MVTYSRMTKTANAKTTAKATKRTLSRGTTGALVPRELIVQIGGHLALDFCNTAGEHLAARPDELLLDWESLLRWATQIGLIGPQSYSELITHPEPIDAIILLRESIYRTG